MGFKSNWNEATQGSSIKPEGDYECLIAKVEERVTKNGKENLNISMVIRNDVEQNYKMDIYLIHCGRRKSLQTQTCRSRDTAMVRLWHSARRQDFPMARSTTALSSSAVSLSISQCV